MTNNITNTSDPNKINFISPENFNNFTYSKKSHFEYFQKNNYDIDLYGYRIESENSDVRIYQNLLVYAFIVNNIEIGSSILEIGNEYSPVIEILKNDYLFYIISPGDFNKDINEVIESINPVTENLVSDKKRVNRKLFDFIYTVSFPVNENTDEFFYKNFMSNTKALLKPLGYSLNCIFNILKDGYIFIDSMNNYLFNNLRTENEFIRNDKILKDRDLFVMSKMIYEKIWEKDLKLKYNEYGMPFSSNILWKKQELINPDNFNEFTFSSKSNINFFLENGYDIELYRRKISPDDFDLEIYQELLIYAFITSNFKKKSKILKIGKDESQLTIKLKNDYELWMLNNSEEIGTDIFSESGNYIFMSLECNNNQHNNIPHGYFDFIYSISSFTGNKRNDTFCGNTLFNINRSLKPGAFSLHTFLSVLNDKYLYANYLMFYFYNTISISCGARLKNKFILRNQLLKDLNLFFKNDNSLQKLILGETGYPALDTNKILSYNLLWKKEDAYLSIISHSRPSDTLEINPAYIFHHLMKCGGTSVALNLGQWFKVYFDHIEDNYDLNHYFRYKFNIDNIYSDCCIISHFQYNGFLLNQRYPEVLKRNKDFRIFTFIRDPLQLVISLYYYGKEENRGIDSSTTLSDYIYLDNKNFLSTLFPCDESNYKEVLDRYFFIGIVERMQESFDKLAKLTKKKRIILPVVNKSEKDSQILKITPEFVKKFRESNKLDYLIYEYCIEKFNRICENN